MRIFWQAACLSLFSTGLVLAGCSEAPAPTVAADMQPRPALIYTVQSASFNETSFTGVIRAAQQVELAFRQSGKLTKLDVQVGQQVSAGQVLSELDNRELAVQLDSARVELQQAQANYDRAAVIYRDSQAISRSELEQLAAKRDVAANKVSQAEQSLDNSILKAPFSGVVAQKLASNFQTVQANQPILVLQDPENLEIAIEVPAKYFVSPKAGMHGLAEVENLPAQRFAVTYRYHARTADPQANTYQVILGFAETPASRLLPGMNVRVFARSAASAGQNHVLVPVTAVVPTNQGQQFLWLVGPDGKVQRRTVMVGRLFGDQIEVTDGLLAGDRIVTAGVQALTEGMAVYAMEQR